MELWIRSQDKMKLVKVNYCYIMDQNDHFTIIGETIDSGPIIAIYKTKERALEVLDEIQNKITKFNLKTDYSCTDNIYEMPKE